MIKKLYPYLLTDNLKVNSVVGKWIFQGSYNGTEHKKWDTLSHTIDSFLNILFKEFSEDIVHLYDYEIKIITTETDEVNLERKKKIFHKKPICQVDFLKELFLKNTKPIRIQIDCVGFVILNQQKNYFLDLFLIELLCFENSFELWFSTNNFSFLPNNPLTGEPHLELWKNNAPRLAKTVKKIVESNPHLNINSEAGDAYKYGTLGSPNFYFISNNAISGFKSFNDKWDEYYVPFELLKTEEE